MLAESRRMKLVKYALSECVGAGVSIRFEDLEAGWEKLGLSGQRRAPSMRMSPDEGTHEKIRHRRKGDGIEKHTILFLGLTQICDDFETLPYQYMQTTVSGPRSMVHET